MKEKEAAEVLNKDLISSLRDEEGLSKSERHLATWPSRRPHKEARRRERNLKLLLRVPAIIFRLFQVTLLAKCVLSLLELN